MEPRPIRRVTARRSAAGVLSPWPVRLTGPNAALGINILDGVKVALDGPQQGEPRCQVTIKQFDTEGDPQKATQVAPTSSQTPR